MTTIEIKSNFHKLIDNIENENILTKFYEIMLNAKAMKEESLWTSLTQKEQEELLEIEKESQDPANLIDHSEMKSKHKKWL